MKITRVNEQGIQYLKAWITATSKRDDAGILCSLDQRAIDAWCQEIESGADNLGSAQAEMSSIHTASGNPEIFTMPDDGITVEYLDDKE
jgi:hypothetical protein